MDIFCDAIVAFLCCAGIVMVFATFYRPKRKACTRVAGLIISDDLEDIVNWSGVLSGHFTEIIAVTNADIESVLLKDVKLLSPEEFKEYVTGSD